MVVLLGYVVPETKKCVALDDWWQEARGMLARGE